MKKTIFVVSTYYHALISCVKQLNNRICCDIMVTDYIPDALDLSERIKNSKLFNEVFFVGDITEYHAKNKLDVLFLLHRKNPRLIEPLLPIDFSAYSEINIFHDDTWVAHFLKDKRIPYRLIEDGLDSFKNIESTNFTYMVTKKSLYSKIKERFNIGYTFSGDDRLTYEIEVNSPDGLKLSNYAKSKLSVVPRKPLFDALDVEDIDVLKDIFLHKLPDMQPENAAILLTQPLAADGYVADEAEQVALYQRLVKQHIASNETLIIKPHPRDVLDYSKVFPNAIILNKNMPSEMLGYIIRKPFKKAVAFNSTSMLTIMSDNHIHTDILKYKDIGD